MGLDAGYGNGQTPLEEEEKAGLQIPAIATREALDEFEQQNIEEALQWVLSRSLRVEAIPTERFIRNLHKRMFGHVWSWAGKFRQTDKNLGIDKWQIPVAVQALCKDALYWVRQKTFPPDEIALRFKHRLVSIHAFPNGNGRHSRLMADVLINKVYGLPLFTWGDGAAWPPAESRSRYLKAMKAADRGDYRPLLIFARS